MQNLGLVAAIIAVVAVSFVVGGSASHDPEERFAGTDDQATSQIEEIDPDYTPWFGHLFEPASGEVEAGLFALQAGLGGTVLGFAIGGYWGRRRAEKAFAAATASDDEAVS